MGIIILTGEPIIKRKTFCPNPVARFGVPDYADSLSNPKVVGTIPWREYWETQIMYCKVGYFTGKMWIPGRYYYYLNFYPISTVGRGAHYPEYIDMDYEFFMLVEQAKTEGYGIICVKARRKGLSFKASCILDHGMRFNQSDYRAGICGSLDAYAKSFYKKYKMGESVVPPEFRMGKLKNSQEETVLGYNVKEETGYIEMGSRNSLLVRTMFADTNVFKGEQLDDCVFEEAGENEKLESCYGATRACFMDGEDMVGTPYLYGTGDKMKKSGDFKKMWYDSDQHGLLKFWVSRRKLYPPAYAGNMDRNNKLKEDIPYLKEKYPYEYQRVGMQDEQRAEELFQKQLRKLLAGADRKAFIEFIQNNPGTIEEAFQTFVDNNYNTDMLMSLTLKMMRSEFTYKAYVLDWALDADGIRLQPSKVIMRLAITDPTKNNYDQPWKWVGISNDGMPNPKYRKLHVAGLDGYNQDTSEASKSLGAMCVYRVQPKNDEMIGNKPVCIYYDRPPRKEQFFDQCLKISYLYDLTGDVLCDAMSDSVIEYFKDNGGRKFLALRPKAFESKDSVQQHTWGMKFVGDARDRMEGLVQSDIEDNSILWDFPLMLQDCLGYNADDGNDNDKDLHDAFGLALVQKIVRKITPRSNEDRDMRSKGRKANVAYYDDDGDIQYRVAKDVNPNTKSGLTDEINNMIGGIPIDNF